MKAARTALILAGLAEATAIESIVVPAPEKSRIVAGLPVVTQHFVRWVNTAVISAGFVFVVGGAFFQARAAQNGVLAGLYRSVCQNGEVVSVFVLLPTRENAAFCQGIRYFPIFEQRYKMMAVSK